MKQRLDRALISLTGLAIGDGLGEILSSSVSSAVNRIATDDLPRVQWIHTDDTEMALAIVETLRDHGYINQDALASRFAERFFQDPHRGYGKMARMILARILAGDHWQSASSEAFNGSGSMGNGAAMRVAPLGAFFADDLETTIKEAGSSAVVTHSHPEGIAGSIAIALAAASVWQNRDLPLDVARERIADVILSLTPRSKTFDGIARALQFPYTSIPQDVAMRVGNGSLVTSPDTVPFALWAALRHLDNYVEAISTTVSVDGDCDTNCAIVGGIVALFSGATTIPPSWSARKEVW